MNHEHALAVYFVHYNFVRIHQTLRSTPARKAGVTGHLWTLEEDGRADRHVQSVGGAMPWQTLFSPWRWSKWTQIVMVILLLLGHVVYFFSPPVVDSLTVSFGWYEPPTRIREAFYWPRQQALDHSHYLRLLDEWMVHAWYEWYWADD